MRSVLLVLAVAILFSCKTDPGLAPRPDPAQRWRSFNIHDYTIEQVRSCFCIYGGQRMQVIVRADTVASVVRMSDGQVLSAEQAEWYWSVDDMFAFISRSRDSLVVRYNGQYGYPEHLDINPQLHPVDGGVLYLTTNLQR